MTGKEYLYVLHHEISKRESEGWVVVNDFSASHHGYHSVLMERDVDKHINSHP